MEDLVFKTASELAALIKSGKVTSVQVVTAHLEQIRKHNSKIHAVVTLRAQEALAEAKEADLAVSEGRSLGPLHGVPITIKDAFRVKGILSTHGALPQYRKHIPSSDCELVRRLRDSGAILLGRTNVPFMSFDWQCSNPLFQECVNPWDKTRVPGGSSGGPAAAVAAGFTPLELGSDIAGSIRYPAHCCGILGLRTTDGLLPIDDIGPEDLPQAFHRLVTCGPMARDLGDIRLMLQILTGSTTDQAPRNIPTGGKLKIGFSHSLAGIAPNEATRKSLDRLRDGLRSDGHDVREGEAPAVDIAEAYRVWGIIAGYELKPVLPPFMLTPLGRLLFDGFALHFKLGNGPLTRWFKKGLSASQSQYEDALAEREKILQAADTYFDKTDLWILPVSPAEAIPRQWGGRSIRVGTRRIPYSEFIGSYLAPLSVLGTPVLTLPVGFGESGLPIAVQIHGARFSDHQLLNIIEKHFSRYLDVRTPPAML